MLGPAVEIDEHPRERTGVDRDAEVLGDPLDDLERAVIPTGLRSQDVIGHAEVNARRQRPRRVLARENQTGHD
jgi:hypothetical protein